MDSRSVGCGAPVGSGCGDLEQAARAPSRMKATILRATSRTEFRLRFRSTSRTVLSPSPLSPQGVLAVEYRFECGLRFLRQMVGLSIVRELVRNNVGLEGQYGMRDQGSRVSVAANEFCRLSESQVDEVVEDQHLAVAIRTSADANGRRFDLSRNHGRDFAWNAFKHNTGHAGAVKRDRIPHKLLDAVQSLALNFIAAHHIDR